MLFSHLALLTLFATTAGGAALADEPDVSAALVDVKNPRWEVKGKAIPLAGQAYSKYKSKKYDEAIAIYLRALDAQPGGGTLMEELSWTLARAGHISEASQIIDLLVERFPKLDDVWQAMDLVGELSHDAELMRRSASELSVLSPTSTRYYFQQIDALLSEHRLEEAVTIADTAAEKMAAKDDSKGKTKPEPEEADAEDSTAGSVACMSARVKVAALADDAEEKWAECVAEGSEGERDRVESWRALAVGDWAAAALHAHEFRFDAQKDLAVAFLRIAEGNADSAVNLLKKAHEHDSTAMDVQVLYARTLHDAGRSDEALKILEPIVTGDLPEDTRCTFFGVRMDWESLVMREAGDTMAHIRMAAGDEAAAEAIRKKISDEYGVGPSVTDLGGGD